MELRAGIDGDGILEAREDNLAIDCLTRVKKIILGLLSYRYNTQGIEERSLILIRQKVFPDGWAPRWGL